jgi:hypothetical protein
MARYDPANVDVIAPEKIALEQWAMPADGILAAFSRLAETSARSVSKAGT